MLIHGFVAHSRVNGPGMRAVVYFQGCNLGCAGCWGTTVGPEFLTSSATIRTAQAAAIGLEGSDPSCHLLWSRWQRARFTCRLLNHLVPTICDVVQRPAISTAKGKEQS